MTFINLRLRTFASLWRQSLLYSLLIIICGAIYVGQYWSPSSYGVVLTQMGVPDSGLVYGIPRPIRSDEWAVVTPLTQATVNNGFERVNKTSFYKEDLRINYGLPIFDWGLIFKPTMWAYLIVEPARAYSFHWFAILALFLVGHALLFSKLGLGRSASILLSIGLYYTGFSQFWWNEKGPILAFFPWVIWVLLLSRPVALRLVLFYWISASWLITNFYPPVFLSLSFVGAIILLAFGREWLAPRRFIALLGTTALSGGTAALYLSSYLRHTSTTIYPGRRNAGGGGVPWAEWFAQFFPFNTFDWKYESVIGQNICEVGCVGAAFILMMICFLDYRENRIGNLENSTKRQNSILIGGLALMYAWMLLPLPPWVGAPLLWNNVQPERMEYASGLLLLLIAALLGKSAKFSISPLRIVIYIVVVISGWVIFKGLQFGGSTTLSIIARRSNDLVVIPILLMTMVLAKLFSWRLYTTMLAASAISSAIVLVYFNPIQSALPIFSQHDTKMIRFISEQVRGPGKMLAISGTAGAVLNGLGYSSVAHVTAVPALDFWRKQYPAMPDEEFLGVFNRYSHIQLADTLVPDSPNPDAVRVPLQDFWPNRVEVPISNIAPRHPLWFRQGQTASGQIVVGRTGVIENIAILIGTGQGQSDGVFQIRLCTANKDACVTGSKPLADALDNKFLTFQLTPSLKIAEARESLHYEFGLSGGKNSVALWTQQAVASDSSLFRVDGMLDTASPKFQIDFK